MTNKVTDIYYGEKELGKNLYRKKTYYTLCVEQDVLADNQDEADNLFLEGGGIDYSADYNRQEQMSYQIIFSEISVFFRKSINLILF